jgi:GntR family transcriptional regulator/MocR family aminotransferase
VGKAKVIGQGAGLHIVVVLANSISNEVKFIDKAKRHVVHLLPFSVFYASGGQKNNRRLLGFGGLPIDKSPQGIKLLSKHID